MNTSLLLNQVCLFVASSRCLERIQGDSTLADARLTFEENIDGYYEAVVVVVDDAVIVTYVFECVYVCIIQD